MRRSWGFSGRSWGVLGGSWGRLGAIFRPFGAVFEGLRAVEGRSGGIFRHFVTVLGPSWDFLRCSGGGLRASRGDLEALRHNFWEPI